jgi:hypothetical protein
VLDPLKNTDQSPAFSVTPKSKGLHEPSSILWIWPKLHREPPYQIAKNYLPDGLDSCRDFFELSLHVTWHLLYKVIRLLLMRRISCVQLGQGKRLFLNYLRTGIRRCATRIIRWPKPP